MWERFPMGGGPGGVFQARALGADLLVKSSAECDAVQQRNPREIPPTTEEYNVMTLQAAFSHAMSGGGEFANQAARRAESCRMRCAKEGRRFISAELACDEPLSPSLLRSQACMSGTHGAIRAWACWTPCITRPTPPARLAPRFAPVRARSAQP